MKKSGIATSAALGVAATGMMFAAAAPAHAAPTGINPKDVQFVVKHASKPTKSECRTMKSQLKNVPKAQLSAAVRAEVKRASRGQQGKTLRKAGINQSEMYEGFRIIMAKNCKIYI